MEEVNGKHCSECGEPIEEEPVDLEEQELPANEGLEQGPVKGGDDRVYCSLYCAAWSQGWLFS